MGSELNNTNRPPRQARRFANSLSRLRSELSGYRSKLSHPGVRLAVALAITLVIVAAMFLFTSRAYEHMSPLALRITAVAKWVFTALAAISAAFLFWESRKPNSAKTVYIVTAVNAALALFLSLGLEPPPRFSVSELRKLKEFNAEFDGVRITPDLERIAEGVELANETDPLKLAQSRLARGKLEEALQSFDQALIEMKPLEKVIAETHVYKALTLSRLGREQEAVAEADLAHAVFPGMSLASYTKCRSLHRLGRLGAALPVCNLAIKEDPTNGLAWGEKGSVLIGMGLREMGRRRDLFEEGIAASNICINLLPDNPSPWNNKAVAFINLGRPREAVNAANRALALHPDFADALLNKASAFRFMGQLDRAGAIYREMVSKNPYDPEAWNNLGDVFEAKGEFAKALEYYSAAAQQKSNYGDAWYNKGHMLNLLGRHSEAVPALRRAVRINDNDYEAFYQLAIGLFNLGREGAAIESLDKAMALNPDFEEARQMRAELAKP